MDKFRKRRENRPTVDFFVFFSCLLFRFLFYFSTFCTPLSAFNVCKAGRNKLLLLQLLDL